MVKKIICTILALNIVITPSLLLAREPKTYWQELECRRNMPETQEDFYKLVDIQFEHFRTSHDAQELIETLQRGYKKSWWDRNPGWTDVIRIGTVVTLTVGFMAMVVAAALVGDNNNDNRDEEERRRQFGQLALREAFERAQAQSRARAAERERLRLEALNRRPEGAPAQQPAPGGPVVEEA